MDLNLTAIIVLLVGLVVCAMACILLSDLVKAGVAIAATSAILSIIMFVLKAPLAAAFELSVCAGLIPVIFISAISMTKIRSKKEIEELKKERKKRFFLLPVLIIILFAVMLLFFRGHIDSSLPNFIAQKAGDVHKILWNERQIDLLGQIIIILSGVFGVIIFFKESETE